MTLIDKLKLTQHFILSCYEIYDQFIMISISILFSYTRLKVEKPFQWYAIIQLNTVHITIHLVFISVQPKCHLAYFFKVLHLFLVIYFFNKIILPIIYPFILCSAEFLINWKLTRTLHRTKCIKTPKQYHGTTKKLMGINFCLNFSLHLA